MNCSTPGLPVHHHLPEFTQTHIHRPSSQWCHLAISSSVIPFSSCPQSFPASGSFPMTQLFTWGGQSIGVSASTSVFPMNTQVWSPLGWTGWISLQSKGLSRVLWDKLHAQMSGKLQDCMSTGTWVYQVIVPFIYSLSPPFPSSFLPSFFLSHPPRKTQYITVDLEPPYTNIS